MIRDPDAPRLQGIGGHQSEGSAKTYFYSVSRTSGTSDPVLGQISIETKFVQRRKRDHIKEALIDIYIYFISIVSIGSGGNPKKTRGFVFRYLAKFKRLKYRSSGSGSTAPALAGISARPSPIRASLRLSLARPRACTCVECKWSLTRIYFIINDLHIHDARRCRVRYSFGTVRLHAANYRIDESEIGIDT